MDSLPAVIVTSHPGLLRLPSQLSIDWCIHRIIVSLTVLRLEVQDQVPTDSVSHQDAVPIVKARHALGSL